MRALELIVENGYAATTVGQIAKAADVSPSTFFRYFQTKEDAVLADDYDALMIESFRRQPAELAPFDAFRKMMRDVFDAMTEAERGQERLRIRLILTIPELRDRMLGTLASNITLLSGLLADRLGRSADEAPIQHFAGAIVGVSITAMLRAVTDPTLDPLVAIDEAIADLAAGLPL
jgi:AcrR family transcriptional regulator